MYYKEYFLNTCFFETDHGYAIPALFRVDFSTCRRQKSERQQENPRPLGDFPRRRTLFVLEARSLIAAGRKGCRPEGDRHLGENQVGMDRVPSVIRAGWRLRRLKTAAFRG